MDFVTQFTPVRNASELRNVRAGDSFIINLVGQITCESNKNGVLRMVDRKVYTEDGMSLIRVYGGRHDEAIFGGEVLDFMRLGAETVLSDDEDFNRLNDLKLGDIVVGGVN